MSARDLSTVTIAMSKPEDTSKASEHWNELLERVATHADKTAFAHLFKHFAPLIKGYCLSSHQLPSAGMHAEDIVQDVMLAIWNKAHTYDRTKASASTWIFTIARNQRIDHLRRQRPTEPLLDTEDLWEDEGADPFSQTQSKQTEVRVRASLRELPHDQVQVLAKVFNEGKSHSEVADEMQLPLGTVKSRVRLALQKLKVGVKELM